MAISLLIKYKKKLFATLVVILSFGNVAPVATETPQSVVCTCRPEYLVLSEDGQNPFIIGEGEDLSTKNLMPDDSFGPSFYSDILVNAIQGLSKKGLIFYADGTLGDSENVYQFWPETKIKQAFPNAELVLPNGGSDWVLDFTKNPVCVPEEKQNTQFLLEVFTQAKLYTAFKMSCNDTFNAQLVADTEEDEPVAGDPIVELARKELNRIGTTDVSEFLGRAIGVLMGVMGSIALAMFVYAGFLFMISGTADSVEKARSILVWSSMGIVVVFASYALVQLIFATF